MLKLRHSKLAKTNKALKCNIIEDVAQFGLHNEPGGQPAVRKYFIVIAGKCIKLICN